MKNFFKKIFKSEIAVNPIKKQLLGIWVIDPDDIEALQLYGNTKMTFNEDDTLIHEIILEDKKQIINLTYEIQDGLLITDQPSNPRKEITQMEITENKLHLWFDGFKSTFIKQH